MAKIKKQEEKSDSLLYTQAVSKVEEIIAQIENNDLALEELLIKTKEACSLLSFCKEKLYTTQSELSELVKNSSSSDFSPRKD